MNGTKAQTDGHVRKDFPGGFPGDAHNAFTREGRTKIENEMFDWMSKVLHWRQGNEVITKGKMTQFIPYKGVYVIARQYRGRTVLTIVNGTRRNATMEMKRYAELFQNGQKEAKDIVTGRKYSLRDDLQLSPRQALILEY